MAQIDVNNVIGETANDGKSKLLAIANVVRPQMLATNTYTPAKPFSDSHPNAISDGDEKGKNELGSSIDIQARTRMLASNKFTFAKPYRLEE